MPTRKPVVKYRPSPSDFIEVGHSAYIHPINHPDTRLVTNNKFVLTSMVEAKFSDGQFETMNTLYQPDTAQPKQEN